MPLHTTEAFVLRTYKLAEADKICVFLTRDLGKVRGVAHGARKMRSRFGSALEPFTEVALTYYLKEGRELVSVSTCEILRSHFDSAARGVETAAAFSYMAELLAEFLPEHEANEKLYRLVGAVLESIEAGHDLPKVLRYFECWLLRLVGFFPDISSCAECGSVMAAGDSLFLTVEGAPRCRTCSDGRGMAMPPDLRDLIREILRVHPSDFGSGAARRELLTRLGEINYQIIRHSLERDLRSREPLKRLGGS